MEVFSEFHTSVEKALEEIDPKWNIYKGLVICGTHTPKISELPFLLDKIKDARKNKIPFLGICYGHQLAAIEYARNVLGIQNATSEEFGQGVFIVKKRPELKVGLHEGESWWNNYEVEKGFEDLWEKNENFITTQYHPEYQSSKDKPHKVLVKFLQYAKTMAM